jgi:hypothetical protein
VYVRSRKSHGVLGEDSRAYHSKTTVRTCQYCNDADADDEADADSIPLLYINNVFEIQISYESMKNSAGQLLDRSEQKKRVADTEI